MKINKILACTLLISSGISYAATIVNLSNNSYTCSKSPINNTLTESDIRKKCSKANEHISKFVKDGHNNDKVSGGNTDDIQDDDETITDNTYDIWSFINDSGQSMKCYFTNHKLIKCTIKN